MRFSRPRPPRALDAAVPMINVVFLLLIFFMMATRIAPPAPFEITLPQTPAETPLTGEDVLHIAADGTLGFRGLQGDASLTALEGGAPERLILRADAALPAPQLAQLLTRLASFGVTSVDLAIRTP